MNLGDREAMNDVISNVLRYGVLISAAILLVGTVLLVVDYSFTDSSVFLGYIPGRIPHSSFSPSLSALALGVAKLDPFSVIELGVIVLIATPVSRVFFSILLFAAEKDMTYVKITLVVLALLLFSMLVTPFIPAFHA
ncbi:MAG: DUF1634 domain-containing protein [Nitrososphaerota archaeon]|nr:DUF1634 domain-containing protein [Nitrososphaerota archaeon]MDG6974889.1 DUF1634 domain-containing protein [Nitrososphaerota archaeon]MDG7009821.1 DUF1634 domain-containing protein [Nitrososphaerota archaeon]MDG7028312.1 DUF1634 domain-containing protein [Nitrososphaerota archaeon]MDG7030881.1 DUF1634 domain-containing protein [Nitrososphaerota archaeon]